MLGQWKHLLDVVPADFSLLLQRAMLLVPVLFPELWHCTGVLLTVGHIFFMCSGHGGVALPVILMFSFILPLSLLMVELPGFY